GRAYDLLANDREAHPLGIVISYPSSAAPEPSKAPAAPAEATRPRAQAPLAKGQELVVGFIGAGSFARSTLLPILRKQKAVRLETVVTTRGVTALQAQRRFGFDRIGTDPDLIFSDPDVHLVFIATRHDSHADLVGRALEAGKHVFVEKPLAINEEQLVRVEAAAARAPGFLMVGFNRRYSPHARALRDAFAGRGPLMMTYRVNAGPLPPSHWLNDPEVGGGRIIGEACHFIDLMSFLVADAPVESIQVQHLASDDRPTENLSAILRFGDGSVGHLLYTAGGSTRAGKE